MAPSPREDSIDQFRGLSIVAMVVANFLGGVGWVPAWLRHAPDVGLTVIDLIAPAFVFAIGLTFRPAAARRLAGGARALAAHGVVRAMALIGIGSVFAAGEVACGVSESIVAWGVLQALGAATLLALPLVRTGPVLRAAAGLALLAGYQVLLDRFWLHSVLASSHGGLQGSLAWGAMLVLATALGDLFHDRAKRRLAYPLAAAATLALGLALAVAVPISKNRVSASYVLVSLGVSALAFGAVHLAATALRARSSLVAAWGRNPLLLYVVHQPLLGLFVLPSVPAWFEAAPPWLSAVQVAALLAAMSALARWLDRKALYLKL